MEEIAGIFVIENGHGHRTGRAKDDRVRRDDDDNNLQTDRRRTYTGLLHGRVIYTGRVRTPWLYNTNTVVTAVIPTAAAAAARASPNYL